MVRLAENVPTDTHGYSKQAVYIKPENVDVWATARRLADERRLSLSDFVADALRCFVAAEEKKDAKKK